MLNHKTIVFILIIFIKLSWRNFKILRGQGAKKKLSKFRFPAGKFTFWGHWIFIIQQSMISQKNICIPMNFLMWFFFFANRFLGINIINSAKAENIDSFWVFWIVGLTLDNYGYWGWEFGEFCWKFLRISEGFWKFKFLGAFESFYFCFTFLRDKLYPRCLPWCLLEF